MSKVYRRTFSHTGISVSNVEAVVEFYTGVIDWYEIMKPTEIIEDNACIGERLRPSSNFIFVDNNYH